MYHSRFEALVPQTLGKDEVGGSNPPNSSKSLEDVMFSRLFVVFIYKGYDLIPDCGF